MAQYFSSNRPVWGLLYQVTTRMFPQEPLYWQVFALFWRWLSAVLVWQIARALWPQRGGFALAAGLLFLVYPGFNAQWAAYLYSHFFIVLCLFLFSLYCSLRTLQRRSAGWLAAGLAASALNLWMMEYFFVLELTRPLLIGVALRDEVPSAAQRARRTLGLWAPYLAVFAAAVLSRFFIFNNQVYGMGLLPRLQADPLGTLLSLAQTALSSLWTVSGAAWGLSMAEPGRAWTAHAGLVCVHLAACPRGGGDPALAGAGPRSRQTLGGGLVRGPGPGHASVCRRSLLGDRLAHCPGLPGQPRHPAGDAGCELPAGGAG
jgi:hypothetical protein